MNAAALIIGLPSVLDTTADIAAALEEIALTFFAMPSTCTSCALTWVSASCVSSRIGVVPS